MSPVDARAARRLCQHVLNPKDKNFLTRPRPTERDKRALNGLPPWDEPVFDGGRFTNRLPREDDSPRDVLDEIEDALTSSGAAIPATWEGALAGRSVSARVVAKVGETKNHDELLADARPTADQFREQYFKSDKRRRDFSTRWKSARASYGDIRMRGKVHPNPNKNPACGLATVGLESALANVIDRGIRVVVAQADEEAEEARRHASRAKDDDIKTELWEKGEYDFRRPYKRDLIRNCNGRPSAEEEFGLFATIAALSPLIARWPQSAFELWIFVAVTKWMLHARNLMIEGHRWIAWSNARKYKGEAEYDDLVQEGTLGLYKAFAEFNPQAGYRFSTFASKAVVWAIESYLRRQRRQSRGSSLEALVQSDNAGDLGISRP